MRIVVKYFARIDIEKIISMFFCLLILSTFIYLSAAANVDISEGRFALSMDERITFDGVRKILHSDGILSFFKAIINGDQRYGRSLWASMATFAYVPEKIWGDSGQIIAGRMLQVFFIASAWFIFAFGILRNWYLRVVLLLAVISMPYSDYYMSMPKPEPLQFFFLAIFCFFYFKKQLAFGWYWIFAGLAFGTKISTLPALVVFVLVGLFIFLKKSPDARDWNSIKISFISFLFGLSAAVPILLVPVLLGIGGFFLFYKIKRKFHLASISQVIIAVVELVLFYILSRKVVTVWLGQTFLNAKHGSDQASINFWIWIKYYFEDFLVIPNYIGIPFFILIIIYITLFSILHVRKSIISLSHVTALSVTLSGIALNLAIYLGVKRLWGFYLYPGSLLMVAGLLCMVDLNFDENFERYSLPLNRLIKAIGCGVAFGIFCISIFSWAPHVINNLEQLSNRTKSEDYILQYASYQEVLKFLNNKAITEKNELKVMLTPTLFPPDNNSKYKIIEFWGPYVNWDESPDVIIFGSVNTPRGKPTPVDSPSYSGFLLERQGYSKHVTEKGGACFAIPCFERDLLIPNGGEILVLKK